MYVVMPDAPVPTTVAEGPDIDINLHPRQSAEPVTVGITDALIEPAVAIPRVYSMILMWPTDSGVFNTWCVVAFVPIGYYVAYGDAPEGATQQGLLFSLGDTRPLYLAYGLSQVSSDSHFTSTLISHEHDDAHSTSAGQHLTTGRHKLSNEGGAPVDDGVTKVVVAPDVRHRTPI